MEIEFDYWLHDHGPASLKEYLIESVGVPEALAQEIAEQRPFYEVTLKCVYDTETKQVSVRSTRL